MSPCISVPFACEAIAALCVMPQVYTHALFECLAREVGVSKAFGRDGPVLVRVGTAAVVGVAAAVAVGVSVGWPYAPAAGGGVTPALFPLPTVGPLGPLKAGENPDHPPPPPQQDAARRRC